MGAALTATSVGITARVLQELGILKAVSGQIILAAAVLDDVMGLIDGLVVRTAKEVLGKEIKTPLPRMTYDEAIKSRACSDI